MIEDGAIISHISDGERTMADNNTPSTSADKPLGCCPAPHSPCIPHHAPPPYYPPPRPNPDGGTAAAITALTNLYNALDAKVQSFIDGIPAIRTALETEKIERISGDSVNTGNINEESSTRASADNALSARIDGHKDRLDNLAAELQREKDVRSATDGDLRDTIRVTKTELDERDAALSARMDRITDGEDSFLNRIIAEENARASADEALGGRIDSVIAESRAKDAVHDTFQQQTSRTLGAWTYPENVADKCAELTRKTTALDAAVTQANSAIAQCASDVSQIDQGLVSTNDYLGSEEEIEQTGESLSKYAIASRRRIESLESTSQTVTTMLDEVVGVFRDSVNEQFREVKNRMTTAERSIADQGISIGTVTAKANANANAINSLSVRVAVLEAGGGGGSGGGDTPVIIGGVTEERLQEALADYTLKTSFTQLQSTVASLSSQNTLLQSAVATLTQRMTSLEARVAALEEGGVTPPAPVVVPSVNFSTAGGDKGYQLTVTVDEYGVPTTDIAEIAASAAEGSPEGLVFRCADDGLLYTLKIVELPDDTEPTTDISRFTGDASSVAKADDYIDLTGNNGNVYRLTIVHPEGDDATTDISLKAV